MNVVDQKIKENFHRDHFSYTVAKAALGNLTQMLALSSAPVLRVNAVFPGLMLPSDDQTQADFEHASRASTPLARIAGPDDVASAILMLTGNAYNGVDFVVDAGQNLIRVDWTCCTSTARPTASTDPCARRRPAAVGRAPRYGLSALPPSRTLPCATLVPGGTLCVSHTLPPITEPRPIVTRPRIVAPA